MPEQNALSREELGWTLSKAAEHGQLIKVWCIYCRTTRYYHPGDLLQLCPNTNVYEVGDRFRCEKCGNKELRSSHYAPHPSDAHRIKVRRLVRVKMIRKPYWKDVPL